MLKQNKHYTIYLRRATMKIYHFQNYNYYNGKSNFIIVAEDYESALNKLKLLTNNNSMIYKIVEDIYVEDGQYIHIETEIN